jgi:HK97 family phage major capsid protein
MALTAYAVEKPFAGHQEGEVMHLDEDQAAALSEYVREATEEDLNSGGELQDVENESEDNPGEPGEQEVDRAALTRAVKDQAKKVFAQQAKTRSDFFRPHSTPAEPKGPVFKGMNDFVRAIYRSKQGDRTSLNKLAAHENQVSIKAPLGANEGTNSQGGYSVVPVWSDEIFRKVKKYPDLLGMTNKMSINSSTYNLPVVSESSLADGSRNGGVLAYWVSEGSLATSSFVNMNTVQAVKNTQVVLSYITNQLLEDNSYDIQNTLLPDTVGEEYGWQHMVAVAQGSGSGQPTGILNQPSLVTVASGSTHGTFTFTDLASMYRRIWPPSRGQSCWLLNPEALNQLIQMVFLPTGSSTGTYPAFGGITYNAEDEIQYRIFGRPVFEVMSLPAIGLSGDIILADLKALTCIETAGMEVAMSTELQFATLQTAFRWVRRYDIKSGWTAAVTPFSGSANTYSPFVCLASRGT